MDAISRNISKKEDYPLGEYSFIKKKYYLQHSLEPGNKYELFFVNSTKRKQTLNINYETNKTVVKIPSKGFYKHTLTTDKYGRKSHVIITSRLYLARPLVFKIMPSSFDVFHG